MSTATPTELDLSPVIQTLTKDQKEASKLMSPREARYLVDRYYQSQEDRKRASNQVRATAEADEPCEAIRWLTSQNVTLENRIRSMLDTYSAAQKLGAWARSNKGIGPVIAAGLLAHIDIAKCPTAGHIWSFAGLDPRTKWMGQDATGKELAELLGEKSKELSGVDLARACQHFRRNVQTILRYTEGSHAWGKVVAALSRQPWNAKLKVLQWKVGESFVKVSGMDDAYYGRLWAGYKAEEIARNDAGEFKQQAADKLERFNIGKTTEAYAEYSKGRLPKGHMQERSKRRVVKLFLSHYHAVGYRLLHEREEPRPWAIEHGGHTHYIPPPNLDVVGL